MKKIELPPDGISFSWKCYTQRNLKIIHQVSTHENAVPREPEDYSTGKQISLYNLGAESGGLQNLFLNMG